MAVVRLVVIIFLVLCFLGYLEGICVDVLMLPLDAEQKEYRDTMLILYTA